MDTVGMFQKFIKLFIGMCPLHVNVISLVTMDVTSLYTNIPHDDGIAACRKIWEQRTVQELPTECLVEMLTLAWG
jgi:hypothetical protein